MPVYSFTYIEYDSHDAETVVSTGRGSVELPADHDFSLWAKDRWPAPRYAIRLERSPLAPRSL